MIWAFKIAGSVVERKWRTPPSASPLVYTALTAIKVTAARIPKEAIANNGQEERSRRGSSQKMTLYQPMYLVDQHVWFQKLNHQSLATFGWHLTRWLNRRQRLELFG